MIAAGSVVTCRCEAELHVRLQSVMCDDSVRRLPTSFFIEDIMHRDDQAHLPGHHAPAVVRPWESTAVTSGSDVTYLRLTAALTLYHWQAISHVSPLCALYKMTTGNFADSLNGNNLQG